VTHNEDWAACAASVDPGLTEATFAELAADLAPVYRRREVRANGLLYLRGLLMPQVAGNCWSIAEAVGLTRSYRLHHLLERAAWDEDAARDAVRAFLARHLSAEGGVLIFDETGPAKKGTATAAVGRQYSGTMGRVENVIVAVYTTYATEHGHALIDRDLYVQRDWFADPARMAAAGFPADHAFATKPAPALAQAKRALAAGISPAWATGDEVYGRSAALREFCEAAGIGTCSRCPSITSSPPPGGCACARTRRSPWSSRKGGTAARAERARKAGATTTGRGSPPTTRGDGCSSGAPLAIRASWRISAPMRPSTVPAR
jgi:SRSO17 transposase